MKALVTGAAGQLGWELRRSAPEGAELLALSRRELDVADAGAVSRAVAGFKPDVILNAAAYTAVDRAESEPEAAYAANAAGAANVARAAKAAGAWLLHVSTDFVFDGRSSRPYRPDAAPNPLGVYGASKRAGEVEVENEAGEAALIVRTSWLYGARGGNFVKTMLRLMGERDELGVVADQVGAPSWTRPLAEVAWRAAARRLAGIHHWSDAGAASWYDLAVAIQEEGRAIGLLEREASVRPIATEDYPTPATRPSYSLLDSTALRAALDITPRHWRASLRGMLSELKEEMA